MRSFISFVLGLLLGAVATSLWMGSGGPDEFPVLAPLTSSGPEQEQTSARPVVMDSVVDVALVDSAELPQSLERKLSPPPDGASGWIAGRVVDGQGLGSARVVVVAELIEPVESALDAAPYRVRTGTDQSGGFIARGLRLAGAYRLFVEPPQDIEGVHVIGDPSYEREPQVVTCPSDGVELVDPSCGLLLELLPSEPSEDPSFSGRFTFRTKSSSSSSSGSIASKILFRVAPDQPFSVEIRIDDMRPVRFEDLRIAAHEGIRREVVILERFVGRPELEVAVTDWRGMPAEACSVWLEAARQGLPPFLREERDGYFGVLRGVQRESSGRYSPLDIVPGAQLLRVVPQTEEMLLGHQQMVTVPETGRLDLAVQLRQGGRAEIRLADEAQEEVRGFRVRPAHTERWWFARLRALDGPQRETNRLRPGERYRVTAVFPAGSWEVRVGDTTVPFSVLVGQVTEVVVPAPVARK